MNHSLTNDLPDRAFEVPPGHLVQTAYIDVWGVRLACRDRMSVGDVAFAFNKRLRHGATFPPPYGFWEKDSAGAPRFVIVDGRHEYLAAVMIGCEFVLVAWLISSTGSPADVIDAVVVEQQQENVNAAR